MNISEYKNQNLWRTYMLFAGFFIVVIGWGWVF